MLATFPLNSVNFYENSKENEESGIIDSLSNSQVGEDPWWNVSFQWRQCLNITNPGSFDLEDNIIKIQFNWKNLYDIGHLQDDLDDIRIVENNVLRRYYIKKDFPSADLATVWFETNSTAGSKDYDTYIYYGNNTVGRAESYEMAKCPDGLARWDFEEGSGTTAYDSMSDKYHGTFVNMDGANYVPTPGIQGDYALSFNGNNEFIALNMSFNYQGGDEYNLTTISGPIYEFTASAWVKVDLDEGGWSILDFDRSEYFTFAAGTRGYRADDGVVEFDCTNDNNQADDYWGNIDIDDSVWHHCVVRFDYSKLFDKNMFVDGVLDEPERNSWAGNQLPIGDISETRFGFIGVGSEATTFSGSTNGAPYRFMGLIDDVRYFDYALSDNEIDWLANYYPLEIDLLGEVERAATVTITVKDEDNRLVPEAEVSLWKNSTHILTRNSTTYTQFTLADGSTEFLRVPFGSYNITVNYTLNNGLDEKVVYDSRTGPGGEVDFKGLFVSTNVTANLWTIDFEVEDSDGDPLDYGYVDIGNSSIYVIDTIPLDSAGEATFRWLSSSSYNYTIYYDNPDYYSHPTSISLNTVTNLVPPQTYTESVVVPMSKLEIRVMDNTGKEGVTGVTVKAQFNNTQQDVVEMETDTDGYAHGDYTTDFGFWYKTGEVYNFTLWIVNQQQTFVVNTSDKPKPGDFTPYYNYTLDQAASLVFFLDLNFTQRIANFTNIKGVTSVVWGQNMTFSLVYETSDDSGQTWVGDWTQAGYATSATWTIYSKYGQKLYEKSMNQALGPTGNFTITINSSLVSAGYESDFYYILITGYKPFWNDPSEVYFGVSVFAQPTGLTLHDYSSPDELPKNIGGDYEISEYYGFTVNISARFYDANTNAALTAESFTYDWDYGSGSLTPGPLPGYYTFELDTSDATNVGKYRIDLTVILENYTQFEDFGMYIDIIPRPTEINGNSGILYVSENIYIFETINFTFTYVDVFTSNPISNLDEKSYLLQKLDEFGDPLPGTTETGSLFETVSQGFVLDLDTEMREDGEYSVIVTLEKTNYEHRIAIISLTIMKRDFGISLPEPPFVGLKIEIPSGAALDFTITVTDPNNITSPPVIGANVYLSILGIDIPFTDNNDGTYTITPTVIAEAFFMPQTFIATLNITKQYFSTSLTSLTVVVKMQEIFGIPTFYFLMIVGSVVAVAGSLVTYRLIQRARIPTFVKKARQMKKNIKGKKMISESLLYPTKEEYISKKLGDKWETIGLSLDDIMGLTEKKKKKLPEVREEFKGGVD
jgi:hypothetical protein